MHIKKKTEEDKPGTAIIAWQIYDIVCPLATVGCYAFGLYIKHVQNVIIIRKIKEEKDLKTGNFLCILYIRRHIYNEYKMIHKDCTFSIKFL